MAGAELGLGRVLPLEFGHQTLLQKIRGTVLGEQISFGEKQRSLDVKYLGTIETQSPEASH